MMEPLMEVFNCKHQPQNQGQRPGKCPTSKNLIIGTDILEAAISLCSPSNGWTNLKEQTCQTSGPFQVTVLADEGNHGSDNGKGF